MHADFYQFLTIWQLLSQTLFRGFSIDLEHTANNDIKIVLKFLWTNWIFDFHKVLKQSTDTRETLAFGLSFSFLFLFGVFNVNVYYIYQ